MIKTSRFACWFAVLPSSRWKSNLIRYLPACNKHCFSCSFNFFNVFRSLRTMWLCSGLCRQLYCGRVLWFRHQQLCGMPCRILVRASSLFCIYEDMQISLLSQVSTVCRPHPAKPLKIVSCNKLNTIKSATWDWPTTIAKRHFSRMKRYCKHGLMGSYMGNSYCHKDWLTFAAMSRYSRLPSLNSE